jgi:putative sterol carrier protein
MKPADFLKLVSGNASGPTMFMTGKLKLEGDVMLASRLTSMFRIPKAG